MEDPISTHLKNLVVSSNECLELKLIRDINDLEDDRTSFKPEMSHQIFGDSETIFGYRDLKVKLYYSAGSLETYLGMTYSEKVNKLTYEGVEADEVLSKVAEKLTPNIHTNLDPFVESLKKDRTFRPYGELLYSFSVNDNDCTRQFEVYKADMTCKGFREYHQRLQTFVLWYIDAANFIDIDDDQWHYFNMFEKYKSSSGYTQYGTIGFATVYQYYAYPHHTRPRIAQVLILPLFQNMGLGTHLLRGIYREYIGRNEVKDITVEDPSVGFQRIRDYVDAMNCSKLPSFSRECLLQGFNKTMVIEAREKHKINKKQARRVYEILRLRITDISNEQEYRDYRLDVKKRLNIPYKREQNDIKKLELVLKNLNKRSNITLPAPEQRMKILEKSYRVLEEDYKKVVKRLEDETDFYFLLLTSYRHLLSLKLSNYHGSIYGLFSEIVLVQKKLFCSHFKMSKYQVKIGIIGGSGLDDPNKPIFNCHFETKREDATNEFGVPSSNLYHGTISGVDVILLSRHGSDHSINPSNINYRANIEALKIAGCTHILASSACGSLTESICRGQLVIPDSFLDRTVKRHGTFFDGTSNKYSGVCHMPMEPAFDPHTSKILLQAAKDLCLEVREGATIVAIEGPRFSSKAESNAFRLWGGHLINMTICPEVCLAKEAGILYAVIAMATDYDCWKECEENVNAGDVLEVFQQNVTKVTDLFIRAIELIGVKNWDQDINNLQELIKSSNVSRNASC
ncbi:histone acetyltransferase type B catalytic subunit-like [Vespa velutina]|uniref:histone acetyltransferase type B catalytic subunit-like n=1 Tax=Vespa velutina TaxID=202808 RepID=UPI001FB43FD0|nr:histone acetyltransferase type B catalytic subunit-like [Vespa velutina]